MASRFTKAFQLISLVLAFAVANVYVMAGPARLGTEPGTDPSAGKAAPETKAAPATAAEEGQQRAEAASERMPLTAGTKTALNRIFSRKGMESRAAAAGDNFLSARTSAAADFKSSIKYSATSRPADDDDSDSGGGGSRGAWIAVGVIAAVLTIAVIGLRHDRHTTPTE